MKPSTDFSVLFLDMNSFFASVEQQVHPELRGQPIGISPYTGPTGCVIAASYEAKGYGVKICRNDEAKRLCPKIKILEARPALYMIYHKEIKKIIESVTPYFDVCSVDEFSLRLDKREQSEDSARKIAINLKQKIKNEVGDSLRCSVGIGPSKFLAKMAAERQKPDGLVVLKLNQLKEFYSKLKLTDLTGINYRMEAQLNRAGIKSPIQLYEMSAGELSAKFKHWGRSWYFRLRGYEVDNFASKTKTIGHSHVLAPEFRNRDGAMAVLRRLIFKAGYRLRKEKYMAEGIMVAISFLDHSSFCVSRKFTSFCDDMTAWEHLKILIADCRFVGKPIHLAVSFFNLSSSRIQQINIFEDIEKSRQISEALDAINDEYGADTIYNASMFSSRETAPDRIPFGKPRYSIRR